MNINVEVIFIIIIAVIVTSSSLASIAFSIYNKYYGKKPNLNIYNNINHSSPNELGGPRFNFEARTHIIVNSGPGGMPAEEEYEDPLPLYEPRSDSYRFNRLDDVNESIGMQVLICRPEPAHDPIDRPPTYRL